MLNLPSVRSSQAKVLPRTLSALWPHGKSSVASGNPRPWPRSASNAFTDLFAPPGLDRSGKLDGYRTAVSLDRLAGLDSDPALRHAIFLDVFAFALLEADANPALQCLGIEMRASRVIRQAVGRRGFGHGGSCCFEALRL